MRGGLGLRFVAKAKPMKQQPQPAQHASRKAAREGGTDSSQADVPKRRVLIGDGHALVRLGMIEFLRKELDLVCCGEAASEAEVRTAVRSARPDLLVLDLWLNGADGLELVKVLRAEFPELLILVCSQLDESLYAERALRAGAMGFIGKDRPLDELLSAIHVVLDGDFYLSRRMSALLLRHNVQGKEAWGTSGVEMLTDRELQVFSLLGAGVGSREAAAKLRISVKTVETYRENIKHKLGLKNAAELLHHAALFVDGKTAPPVESAGRLARRL